MLFNVAQIPTVLTLTLKLNLNIDHKFSVFEIEQLTVSQGNATQR
jgi:hypothetical protein